MSDRVENKTMPSAYDEDWEREKPRQFWDPGRKLLKSIRIYQRFQPSKTPWAFVMRKLSAIRHRFWSVVSGAEIYVNSRISGGLQIPHPNGIVIHPDAKIGPNCLIFQQVTIAIGNGGVPKIGGHVEIGAGAKVLGGIVIGNHVRIGANAVVIHSVLEGQTVAGIPAKLVVK